MADTRLPDVIPATDLGKDKLSSPGSSCELCSHQSEIVANEDLIACNESICNSGPSDTSFSAGQSNDCAMFMSNDENGPSVQIWTSLESASDEIDLDLKLNRRHSQQSTFDQADYFLSDSGIDSQVNSPTHFHRGHNELFLDLSGPLLSVPKCVRREKIPNPAAAAAAANTIRETDALQDEQTVQLWPCNRSETPIKTNILPTNARNHRNFAAVDHGASEVRRLRHNTTLTKVQSDVDRADCEFASGDRDSRESPSRGGLSAKGKVLARMVNNKSTLDDVKQTAHDCLSLDETLSIKKNTANRFSLDEKKLNRATNDYCMTRICVDSSVPACLPVAFGQHHHSTRTSQESCSEFDHQSLSNASINIVEHCAELVANASICSVADESGTDEALEVDCRKGCSNRLSSPCSPLLSVPLKLHANYWSPFIQSQPNSRRPSLHSIRPGSLSTSASHANLSKSVSLTASPYSRLHRIQVVNADGYDLSESSQFIDLNDQYESCNALTLTQRLAFPELVASPNRLAKNRHQTTGHIENESNLNFFAKIITFLVLVFVIVLIVGVLIKRAHTPR